MATQKKTFRFDEKTITDLVKLAELQGGSQTAAVQRAVQEAVQEPAGSHTSASPEKTFDLLAEELKIKNQQIADLSAALVAAQDTAKAAQMLHASEKKEALGLENSEQKETRTGRWVRAFAAWRS